MSTEFVSYVDHQPSDASCTKRMVMQEVVLIIAVIIIETIRDATMTTTMKTSLQNRTLQCVKNVVIFPWWTHCTKWSVLYLNCHKWFSYKSTEWKICFSLSTHVVIRNSNLKFSHHCLADYVKNWTKEHATHAAQLFFFIQPTISLICGNVLPSFFKGASNVMVLLLFSCQNFTNTISYCLYSWVIYLFEHEKKICDKCLRKDLSKVLILGQKLDQFRVRKVVIHLHLCHPWQWETVNSLRAVI